jgi:hypothetical protein
MLVVDPAVGGFAEFIPQCREFWSDFARSKPRPQASNGAVLVELIHNNATVLSMNLLVGLYLADFFGSEIVGFTAPSYTKYPLSMKKIQVFAEAFGAKDVVNIEQGDSRHTVGHFLRYWKRARTQREWQMLRFKLSKLEGERLRKAVLELTLDGVWIGDLVYDSILYPSEKSTISKFDSVLASVFDRSGRIFSGTENLLRHYDARAMVVSHTVYIEYGLPARVALKHGIPVYGKSGLNPAVIRKYRLPDEATIFPGAELHKALQHYRASMGEQLSELASNFYPPTPAHITNLDIFRFGYGSGKREVEQGSLVRLLSLDPQKKTCCIMAHMFVDAPHIYSDLLFDDFYQWLAATLNFAARTPTLNWLVRQHPYEIMVGQKDNFQEVVAPYISSSSVIVVPDDVTTSSLFSCVDAVTTCYGSAGIEFASVGIPCILAGKPYYADYSFTHRPRTQTEYFNALASIPALPPLSAEEMKLAKEIAYVELKCLPVRSVLIPETPDLAGISATDEDFRAWWLDVARRFKATLPRQDPLYQSLHRLFHSNEEYALQSD